MASGYRNPSCSVYVGNLDSSVEEASVTEEILWELFLQAGPLKSVHLPKDRESGLPKKFAFVEFEHEVSVPYACELLNGIRLFGRSIQVKPSTQGGDSSPIPTISPSQSPCQTPPQRYVSNPPMTYDPRQELTPRHRTPPNMVASPSLPFFFQGAPAFPQPQWGNRGYDTSPMPWNPQMGVNPFFIPNFMNSPGNQNANRSESRHRR